MEQQRDASAEEPEVQGHRRVSDENLKQSIAAVENALASLRDLDGDEGSDPTPV